MPFKTGVVDVSDYMNDSYLSLDVRVVGDLNDKFVVLACRRDSDSPRPGAGSYWLKFEPARNEVRISLIENATERLIGRAQLISLSPMIGILWSLFGRGSTLAAKVNGEEVLSVEDSYLSSGYCWLGVGTYIADHEAEAHFDNPTLRSYTSLSPLVHLW